MQPMNNQNITISAEYFNAAKILLEQQSTVNKYIGLALAKISIAININLYVPDTTEDSFIKRGAKCIGRTFFKAVEAIDAKRYFIIGASAFTLSASMALNEISEKESLSDRYLSLLNYFGYANFATFIFCYAFNHLNQMTNEIVSRLDDVILEHNALRYIERITQNHELYVRERVARQLLNQILEDNIQPNNLNMEIHYIIIIVSDVYNEARRRIQALLYEINPIDITTRKNEVIAYNELTLYDGDAISPETLSMISQVALKDAQQPVICEKQLYEYKHLVTWHLTPYPNKDATCPHNRNKLIWSNVQRIER